MVYQFRLAHKLLRAAAMDRDADLILERLEGQSPSTSRSAMLASAPKHARAIGINSASDLSAVIQSVSDGAEPLPVCVSFFIF